MGEDEEMEDRQDFNGEDNVANAFCSTKNCPQCALDQQKNFVQSKTIYLLCLWGMLEHHDLLGSSMHHLNANVCSGHADVGAPSVIGSKHSVEDDVSLTSSKGSNKKIG